MATNSEGCYTPVQADSGVAAPNAIEASISDEEQASQSSSSGRVYSRRMLVGVAVAIGVVVAIVFVGANTSRNTDAPVATQDMVSLVSKGTDLDREMAAQLAEIKRSNPQALKDMKELQKAENVRKSRKLIDHLNGKTSEEAKRIVDDVVQQAAARAVKKAEERDRTNPIMDREWQEKHGMKRIFRELKKSDDGTTIVHHSGKDVAPWQNLANGAKAFHKDAKALKELRMKQTTTAVCVFNAISATEYVARVAFSIENSINFLAVSLAGAASTCAETMNVKALCAASVTGLVGALSQVAASGIVMAEGCKPIQQFIKDNAKDGVSMTGKRRLEALPPAEALSDTGSMVSAVDEAPARRLFLGGNKQVTMGQCVLDITSTAWGIAGIGLSIQAATDSCPYKEVEGTSELIQALLLKKALCTSDVSGILYNFGKIATFIQIAIIHCGQGLNLQAICGAGVAGLLASAAGISKAASGLYASCNVGIKLEALEKLMKSGNMDGTEMNEELGAGDADFARRLQEDPIGTLREQREEAWSTKGFNVTYAEARRLTGLPDPLEGMDGSENPKSIWAKMGYNLDDPNAEWRKKMDEEGFDNHEATDAFIRVMQPYMHEVGEAQDEELQKKWPLWPSPWEEEL